MSLTYLSIGSNLGNKEDNLNCAINKISMKVGNVLAVSEFIQTCPEGFISEHDFLNAVLIVDTCLSPLSLLHETQNVEKEMGRLNKSNGTYADRIIDIDILLYDRLHIDLPQLKIPHPLMTERVFVLNPLVEIAPQLRHPISGMLFSEYLKLM